MDCHLRMHAGGNLTLEAEVDRETYSDFQKTATLWADNQQQRMEHIGAEALTEMVVDSATAPMILAQLAGQAALGDEESQAILREMGNEIKAFFTTSPEDHLDNISESNREQLAYADALEQAGQRDEADLVRMRVALENQTMVMGVGGLAASLPKVASSIVSRPGDVGPGEGGFTQKVDRPTIGSLIDDRVRLTETDKLRPSTIETFRNGEYVTVETTEPLSLFRKFGGGPDQAKLEGGSPRRSKMLGDKKRPFIQLGVIANLRLR